MYSIIVDGKVLDFKWKKHTEFSYVFYIGDIAVGQVFRMRNSWTCVSHTPNKLCPVDGFKTRMYASEFLLKISGYRSG